MIALIVNADDFGASIGTNRGIVEAHKRGIVTSASLMVDMPGSADAGRLAGNLPELSVGLHVDLDLFLRRRVRDSRFHEGMTIELQRQLAEFATLTGTKPTHVDTHHNSHRLALVAETIIDFTNHLQVPLREHSEAFYIEEFYGQWDGQTHPEQITAESLERILNARLRSGINELGCHPGYADSSHDTSYSEERELELRTLTSPRIQAFISNSGITLTNFRDNLDRYAAVGAVSDG